MDRIEVEVGTAKGGLYTKVFVGRWLVEPRTFKSPQRIVSPSRADVFVANPKVWGLALTAKGKFAIYEGNERIGGQEELGGELHVFDSLGAAEEGCEVPKEAIDMAFEQTGPRRTGVVVELNV